MKIFTVAHVPESLAQAWLQYMRNFDKAHEECHFEVIADAPNLTLGEMVEILKINPNLTFEQIIMRKTPYADDD